MVVVVLGLVLNLANRHPLSSAPQCGKFSICCKLHQKCYSSVLNESG